MGISKPKPRLYPVEIPNNEIGYFPNGNRKFCFEDEKEQKLTFFRWLEKRINEGHNIAESMCYYVTGTYMPMCQRTIDMGL